MKIITRKEAKIKGFKKYFSGKPCQKGHISERYVSSYQCCECESLSPNKALLHKQYRIRNPEVVSLRSKQWRQNNPDKHNLHSRNWKKQNPQVDANRRARKLNATPYWSDRKAIKEIYNKCKLLEEQNGNKYHVDHYYPLQGDTVCGLHVPENLVIIPALQNLQKKNTHPENFY